MRNEAVAVTSRSCACSCEVCTMFNSREPEASNHYHIPDGGCYGSV